MSVYIKGMEMPDRCFACPMCDVDCCGISKGPYIEYREVDVDVAMSGRPDWCPLVPVPDHGRLIDADALIEQKEWAFDGVGQTEMVNVAEIVNAPTIIPTDKEGE